MGADLPNFNSHSTSSRSIRFAVNLCVIAWCSALVELVTPVGILKYLSILIGSHAAALGIVVCVVLWLYRRSGVFFLILIMTAIPAGYFGLILRNIALMKGWIRGG